MAPFKLSAQLKGHANDVRGVAFPSPDVILSASRDGTVRKWATASQETLKFEDHIISRSGQFVNAVTFVRKSDAHPEGLVVSGGKEALVEVKSLAALETDNADRLLVGHANNICALDTSPSGALVVSGSWDGTAIVWDVAKWEQRLVLEHESDSTYSVWAVLAYSDDVIVTGSADSKIRLFSFANGQRGQVSPLISVSLNSIVRALCKLPEHPALNPRAADFASADNDGCIALWKMDGQGLTKVESLYGHESFIYSLCCLPTGELVSSGEDRTVRIWRKNECIQTITHPALSVWSVAACTENGDIVTGASDKIVRVFTRSAEREGDAQTVAEFEDSVKNSAVPQTEGRIVREKLDGPEWLQTRAGEKEGQLKMIKEDDGSVGVYQWSLRQQQWTKIGTAVEDSAGSGKKVSHGGKEYDYVFDVDIEDGKPPLKLPYNVSEDVYQAATKFLSEHQLPISYLEAVASFIRKNTKATTIGDPAAVSDVPMTPPSSSFNKFLPFTEYQSLASGKSGPVMAKLKEANQHVIEAGSKDMAINPEQSDRLLNVLKNSLGEAAEPVRDEELDMIREFVAMTVTRWPYQERIPALDVLRCLTVRPGMVRVQWRNFGNIANIALRSALSVDAVEESNGSLGDFVRQQASTSERINVVLAAMAMRAIVNLFASAEGRAVATEEVDGVLAAVSKVIGLEGGRAPQRNALHVALASLSFNYACLAYQERRTDPATTRVSHVHLVELAKILSNLLEKAAASEAQFRSLMALGMLLLVDEDCKKVVSGLGAVSWVITATQAPTDGRVRSVAREIEDILR